MIPILAARPWRLGTYHARQRGAFRSPIDQRRPLHLGRVINLFMISVNHPLPGGVPIQQLPVQVTLSSSSRSASEGVKDWACIVLVSPRHLLQTAIPNGIPCCDSASASAKRGFTLLIPCYHKPWSSGISLSPRPLSEAHIGGPDYIQ